MVRQDNHAVSPLCEDRGSFRSFSIRQWISRQIRVDFKMSVTWHSWFREVNTLAIELIMIASTLVKGSNSLFEEVLYCRCLITNNKEHCIDWISSHTTMQSRWVFILNPEGKYHGMISIMRSSTRSKRTKWYSQCTPDTTSKYDFFLITLWCGASL